MIHKTLSLSLFLCAVLIAILSFALFNGGAGGNAPRAKAVAVPVTAPISTARKAGTAKHARHAAKRAAAGRQTETAGEGPLPLTEGAAAYLTSPGRAEDAAALLTAIALACALILAGRAQRRAEQAALDADRAEAEPLIRELPNESQRNEALHQAVVESANEGIWVVNTSGETTFVNSRMAEILGCPLYELHGRQHIDFMDAEGIKIAEENTRLRRLGLGGGSEFRFVRRDGAVVWAMVTTTSLKDAWGNVTGALAMVTDVTAWKRLENEHKLSKGAITASSNGIVIVDARREDMPVVFVNPAFEQITGYRAADAIGYAPDMLRGEDRSGRSVCALRMARQRQTDISVELRGVRKDDTEYWHEIFVSPIEDERGIATHYVAIINDITRRMSVMDALHQAREELEHKVEQRTAELQAFAIDLQQANEKLTLLASQDELTGLKNPRVFQEQLLQETQRSIRYNISLSILIVDLDNFKDYNEAYGHADGDAVLAAAGRIIESTARQTDIVARYGGDKFAAIMVNTDRASSTALAERIRRNIERETWKNRPITASVGVATLRLGVSEPRVLIDTASSALLHAKQGGRNRVSHMLDLEQPSVTAAE
jgi:diguanylate cyclase (GGDEF)-like protein/PAS domain S-box-containing protein